MSTLKKSIDGIPVKVVVTKSPDYMFVEYDYSLKLHDRKTSFYVKPNSGYLPDERDSDLLQLIIRSILECENIKDIHISTDHTLNVSCNQPSPNITIHIHANLIRELDLWPDIEYRYDF